MYTPHAEKSSEKMNINTKKTVGTGLEADDPEHAAASAGKK
jgi:hypothetical protein